MRRTLAALCAVCTVAACSSGATRHGHSAQGSADVAAVSGSITVFAAASLTEAFTTLGKAFEKAHPGTHLTFDFDASSTLALQINEGAPADVFASAATKNMQQVVSAGNAKNPTDFVKNVMEIAVPPRNRAHITGVTDLARRGVKVALCQPQVPCGAVAEQVFANAGVQVRPVTLEQDVKSTLTKVELGEVDAGVVYVTDVRAAGDKVLGIAIPNGVNASTEYPIAALSHSHDAPTARAFVDFVLGPDGQAVLAADGFEAP